MPERPDPRDQRNGSSEVERDGRIDRWIRPYFDDSALWPLVVVAVAIAASLASGVLLMAVVERNLFALGALLGLGWLSADVVRGDLGRRRLGPTSGLVLSIWGLAALATFAVLRAGLF